LRYWFQVFTSDPKAHRAAAEEVFFVCAISLTPLLLLALIDQIHADKFAVGGLFWSAISSGQLYLYSFSLFGTLFWLCQKEHDNFARFRPRVYLMFLAFAPCVLILGVYLLNPTMANPLSTRLIGISFWTYLLYICLYYILLVFDNFEPPPLEERLQSEAKALIAGFSDLGADR